MACKASKLVFFRSYIMICYSWCHTTLKWRYISNSLPFCFPKAFQIRQNSSEIVLQNQEKRKNTRTVKIFELNLSKIQNLSKNKCLSFKNIVKFSKGKGKKKVWNFVPTPLPLLHAKRGWKCLFLGSFATMNVPNELLQIIFLYAPAIWGSWC